MDINLRPWIFFQLLLSNKPEFSGHLCVRPCCCTKPALLKRIQRLFASKNLSSDTFNIVQRCHDKSYVEYSWLMHWLSGHGAISRLWSCTVLCALCCKIVNELLLLNLVRVDTSEFPKADRLIQVSLYFQLPSRGLWKHSRLFWLFILFSYVSGVRLFDDGIRSTDVTESKALIHALESVDIYSNSWGPGDMAWQVEGPGPLTTEALKIGIQQV